MFRHTGGPCLSCTQEKLAFQCCPARRPADLPRPTPYSALAIGTLRRTPSSAPSSACGEPELLGLGLGLGLRLDWAPARLRSAGPAAGRLAWNSHPKGAFSRARRLKRPAAVPALPPSLSPGMQLPSFRSPAPNLHLPPGPGLRTGEPERERARVRPTPRPARGKCRRPRGDPALHNAWPRPCAPPFCDSLYGGHTEYIRRSRASPLQPASNSSSSSLRQARETGHPVRPPSLFQRQTPVAHLDTAPRLKAISDLSRPQQAQPFSAGAMRRRIQSREHRQDRGWRAAAVLISLWLPIPPKNKASRDACVWCSLSPSPPRPLTCCLLLDGRTPLLASVSQARPPARRGEEARQGLGGVAHRYSVHQKEGGIRDTDSQRRCGYVFFAKSLPRPETQSQRFRARASLLPR